MGNVSLLNASKVESTGLAAQKDLEAHKGKIDTHNATSQKEMADSWAGYKASHGDKTTRDDFAKHEEGLTGLTAAQVKQMLDDFDKKPQPGPSVGLPT